MLAASPGRLQNVLFNLHKNTGLVIFLLALVRLSWRWSNPVPALPGDLPSWQAAAARVTHGLLYALLFLMPISGFLYTALGGFPVPFLMLVDLAQLVPVNKPVAEVFKLIHLGLRWALYALVLLHVAGALQHHLIRRDHVLRRMLSSVRPLGGGTGR